jgi:hypothetical protein
LKGSSENRETFRRAQGDKDRGKKSKVPEVRRANEQKNSRAEVTSAEVQKGDRAQKVRGARVRVKQKTRHREAE